MDDGYLVKLSSTLRVPQGTKAAWKSSQCRLRNLSGTITGPTGPVLFHAFASDLDTHHREL